MEQQKHGTTVSAAVGRSKAPLPWLTRILDIERANESSVLRFEVAELAQVLFYLAGWQHVRKGSELEEPEETSSSDDSESESE